MIGDTDLLDIPTLTQYERDAMFHIPAGDLEPLPDVRRAPVEIFEMSDINSGASITTVAELDPVTLDAVTMRPAIPFVYARAA